MWNFRLIVAMVFAIVLLSGAGLVWLAISGLGGQSVDAAQGCLHMLSPRLWARSSDWSERAALGN